MDVESIATWLEIGFIDVQAIVEYEIQPGIWHPSGNGGPITAMWNVGFYQKTSV